MGAVAGVGEVLVGVISDVAEVAVLVGEAVAVGRAVCESVGVAEAAGTTVELDDPVGSAAAVTFDPTRKTASVTIPSANRDDDARAARVGRRMGVLVLGNDPEAAI